MLLRSADKFLSRRSRHGLVLTALLLVVLVGVSDHLTGYELSFSIFYLIPVGISAWHGGRRIGITIALLSAVVWFWVDFTAGNFYSHPSIPYWNAAVRSGFFLIGAVILVRLHEALALQASLAELDGLTGIPNARAFARRGEAAFQLSARYGHPVAVGYLDLDGFKGVNDRLGHSVGDQLLQAVAREIASRLRASDTLGRLGGDEFGVLLPETDLGGARALFTEIRQGLLELAEDRGWPVGVSIGVAVFRGAPGNFAAALRQADALMYRVKNSGKNSILFEECAESAVTGPSPRGGRSETKTPV